MSYLIIPKFLADYMIKTTGRVPDNWIVMESEDAKAYLEKITNEAQRGQTEAS